ncbi:MAG: hypothetical protein K9G41_12530 [Flavobacteriales bacterium]|nr:hypothetical protein [Flavobacteriales bacterium]
MKQFRIGFFAAILAALALSSCQEDLQNVGWDVDVLAPVLRTRLDMSNLVADSLLSADADGALRLRIEAPLIDLPLDSILKIPDTTIKKIISVPNPLVGIEPGFTFPGGLTDETTYNLGDLALKKVVLRTGKLKLKVKSLVKTEVDFQYFIPLARKDGGSFETSGTVPAAVGTDTAFASYQYDLSGYEIDLRGLAGTGFNTLTTVFTIKTSETGTTVTVAAGPFFILEYGFADILPNYGTGYFGQQSTTVDEDATEIDILNRITDGQMILDSVKIGLRMTNGAGADARFRLSRLRSINSRLNSTIDLSHSLIGTDVLLGRAQDPTGNAADVIATEAFYYLDNGNSNVKQFIENLPDKLGFLFDFDLNPLGNVSSGNDFFYYDRPFQALMDIDIPLRASLTDLTLVDTIEWNLGGNSVVESVNSGSFTLIAVNNFPLEAMVELILMDSLYNPLDTLVPPSNVAAATVNAQNRVTAPRETRLYIPVPNKTSNVLPNTKFVRFRVRFNTVSHPDLIQFYQENTIDLKLIGNFNINFGGSMF